MPTAVLRQWLWIDRAPHNTITLAADKAARRDAGSTASMYLWMIGYRGVIFPPVPAGLPQ
ncbi:MAG: hypothetical protein BGO06_15445 [Shinella sp. 65-6]|nr:MAG: hypothetical protein BGO06_15445 [Shinella sp. 65-6]